MEIDGLLDLMTRQLEAAEAQLQAQTIRSENTEGITRLLHSLRVSLRDYSLGIDPDDEVSASFVLSVEEPWQFLLRWDRYRVPLSGSYFPTLLENAGITLVPDQQLLVDPRFARRLIEESLGDTAKEQGRQEARRGELMSALKQSGETGRDELLEELGRVDKRDADLLIQKIELAELHAAACGWIAEGSRPVTRELEDVDSGAA